jgi:nitroimidazol reductase NimA-like FMN-containing flavoprotein (pyridoxamine 5'-phosphate oxidase superfamily)
MDRLQALSRPECLELLARHNLGRVAFTERALPAIRPVNYALVGSHVMLRTDVEGLGRRLDGQIVAFEVDDVDNVMETGWSVVVTGTARLVRDTGELVRHEAVPLVTMAGPGHEATVCIAPGDITGRRIRPSTDAA